MNFKKRFLLYVFLLLLSVAMVACGGDTDDSDGIDEGGSGGFGTDLGTEVAEPGTDVDLTPMVTEEMDMPATDEATPIIEETPTVAETPMVEETETPLVAATTEVTTTEEVTGTGTLPDATMAMTITQAILASDLVGMDITNQGDEEVGEVSELLIDQDGTVQYAIFDVGGFLGIGEKSVAVPWDNMEIHREEGLDEINDDTEFSADELTVVYTGAATDLENLPEFDTSILDGDGYIMDDDADLNDEFDAAPYTGQLQVSEFQDYNLVNATDEDLGEVEDLIIDLTEGRVVYAVVDFGGFLGVAENSVAVSWDQLQLDVTDDNETFVLDTVQTDLQDAPLFDFNEWTYPVDADWDADFDTYWNTR